WRRGRILGSGGAIKSSRGSQAIVQKLEPLLCSFVRGLINETSDGLRPKFKHLVQLQQRKATKPNARLICERICIFDVLLHRSAEHWDSLAINPKHQLFGRRRRQNLIEENLQRLVRNLFEAERRFAHFADTLTERTDMLGAKMRVQAEG